MPRELINLLRVIDFLLLISSIIFSASVLPKPSSSKSCSFSKRKTSEIFLIILFETRLSTMFSPRPIILKHFLDAR